MTKRDPLVEAALFARRLFTPRAEYPAELEHQRRVRELVYGRPEQATPAEPKAQADSTGGAATELQPHTVVATLPTCRLITTPLRDPAKAKASGALWALDLMVYLVEHQLPRGARGRESISLLARRWGTEAGRGERGGDRYLKALGRFGILDRNLRGSVEEWVIADDWSQRFRRAAGFTVSGGVRPRR